MTGGGSHALPSRPEMQAGCLPAAGWKVLNPFVTAAASRGGNKVKATIHNLRIIRSSVRPSLGVDECAQKESLNALRSCCQATGGWHAHTVCNQVSLTCCIPRR